MVCFLNTHCMFQIVCSLCSKLSSAVITPTSRVPPLKSFVEEWAEAWAGRVGPLGTLMALGSQRGREHGKRHLDGKGRPGEDRMGGEEDRDLRVGDVLKVRQRCIEDQIWLRAKPWRRTEDGREERSRLKAHWHFLYRGLM